VCKTKPGKNDEFDVVVKVAASVVVQVVGNVVVEYICVGTCAAFVAVERNGATNAVPVVF